MDDLDYPPRSLSERVVGVLRGDAMLTLLDVAVVVASYLIALVLRFDASVPSEFWDGFWRFELIAAALHIGANHVFGLYGRMWRYASVHEARQLGLASITVVTIIVGLSVLQGRERFVPISVAVIGGTICFLGLGAIRFQSRLFGLRRRGASERQTRILIVGAGDAGSSVLSDISRNPSVGLRAVGFVDDDHRKIGRKLRGIPVLGDHRAIPALIPQLEIDQVLFAIPSATGDVLGEVASLCESAGVTLKVLPTIHEIIGGRVTVRDIRDLSIEDLLGRQQVETDLQAVRATLEGHRVLITGAGGSIGAEIARQVASFQPSRLILLDHDETHLHDITTDLRNATAVLVNIRDRAALLRALGDHRPQVIFHAAAHKHVPLLEAHPEEAFLTNVLGTLHVVEAARTAGTERFVLISTDKAVRPSSVMGASKQLAEQLVLTAEGDACIFCSVRFGNVVGSRGSVIPTFLRQINRGGPLTITHPDMTRYFMSVHEAVELVLQAAAMATGGEVFTLDMGEAVNIRELAYRVIRLSGRIPEREIAIEFVGPRPGEKLAEDVLDPDEHPAPSAHPAIVVSRSPVPEGDVLRRGLQELEALASQGRSAELASRMRALAGGSEPSQPQQKVHPGP